MRTSGRIAVFGAGSVGCYVGGRLAVAGGDVAFIGRARMHTALAQGMRLTDYRGADLSLPAPRFTDTVAGADLVLVCVKSADTPAAAEALRPHLATDARVISFQNGVGNAGGLAEALGRPVLAGMVAFNVARDGARFHQGTEGDLHVARDPALPLDLFARAGLPLRLHDDMTPVLWAKLMLNLNNAVNALSGLPLQAQLSDRGYRRCLALAQDEALGLCAQAGIRLARLSPLPAGWIPRVLRLPDPLFRALAGRMLRIDPQARSSMADDLAAGRATEIDWINGEVCRLAERLGGQAPVNRTLTTLMHQAEATPAPRRWSAGDLLGALRAS
ncbi:MAG: 2-dehydropantoate 2-reductase [Rhodobacter sp.]|nr:2-dehydropantoate 2-reductase [Paracoccaceae bacterium]MCC0076245.1 2-dehydropantoate 2-reductase [Rhodobacter sp.]